MNAAALTLALGTALCAACGGATSTLMKPVAGPPSPRPSPGKALVLFAADIEVPMGPSLVVTIYDENKHFLGQLFEHSMFEVELPPGKHGFAAIDLKVQTRFVARDKQFFCGDPFTADLEAGKVYVAWLRGEPLEGNIVANRWVFGRPDAKLLNVADALKVWRTGRTFPESKPFLQPDTAAGQAFVDSFGTRLCVPPTEPRPNATSMPASFGLNQLPE